MIIIYVASQQVTKINDFDMHIRGESVDIHPPSDSIDYVCTNADDFANTYIPHTEDDRIIGKKTCQSGSLAKKKN